MSEFGAAYARQSMTGCLRPGESMTAFTEGADDDGAQQAGFWADAGTTWFGVTSARILEVHSANGEVMSTPWAEVADVHVKAGFVGCGHISITHMASRTMAGVYKVDKAFAKQMRQAWTGPKSALAAESTTVSLAWHQRLNTNYWFCDSCGQPCGTPKNSQTPRAKCAGCCRSITGIRG
jgi:hypothetical protein